MQDYKKGLSPFKYIVPLPLSHDRCPNATKEKEHMKVASYASLVSSHIHAMLCTKVDIRYNIGIVSKYQPNSRLEHWTTMMCILKYLRRARNYMLVCIVMRQCPLSTQIWIFILISTPINLLLFISLPQVEYVLLTLLWCLIMLQLLKLQRKSFGLGSSLQNQGQGPWLYHP